MLWGPGKVLFFRKQEGGNPALSILPFSATPIGYHSYSRYNLQFWIYFISFPIPSCEGLPISISSHLIILVELTNAMNSLYS